MHLPQPLALGNLSWATVMHVKLCLPAGGAAGSRARVGGKKEPTEAGGSAAGEACWPWHAPQASGACPGRWPGRRGGWGSAPGSCPPPRSSQTRPGGRGGRRGGSSMRWVVQGHGEAHAGNGGGGGGGGSDCELAPRQTRRQSPWSGRCGRGTRGRDGRPGRGRGTIHACEGWQPCLPTRGTRRSVCQPAAARLHPGLTGLAMCDNSPDPVVVRASQCGAIKEDGGAAASQLPAEGQREQAHACGTGVDACHGGGRPAGGRRRVAE